MMKTIGELAEHFEARLAGNKVMEAFHRSGRGEVFTLKYLYRKQIPVLPSELGEALGSSAARISAVLRSLEAKGAIQRETDPTDRRNVLVTLTDAGREHTEKLIRQVRERLIRVFNEMGEERANSFYELNLEFFSIAKRTMSELASFEIPVLDPRQPGQDK